MTLFVLLGVVCTGAVAGTATWFFLQRRRGIWAVTCDLRRCLVLIGPEQNDDACVAQRRALKPLLMRVRHIGMNVIEVYGSMTPRRNGRPLEWLDNGALRRTLKAGQGFHLICLDDESEVILRSHRPVSESSLSEFIAMEEPIALPAPVVDFPTVEESPAPTEEAYAPSPLDRFSSEPETSWGRVGVLR